MKIGDKVKIREQQRVLYPGLHGVYTVQSIHICVDGVRARIDTGATTFMMDTACLEVVKPMKKILVRGHFESIKVGDKVRLRNDVYGGGTVIEKTDPDHARVTVKWGDNTTTLVPADKLQVQREVPEDVAYEIPDAFRGGLWGSAENLVLLPGDAVRTKEAPRIYGFVVQQQEHKSHTLIQDHATKNKRWFHGRQLEYAPNLRNYATEKPLWGAIKVGMWVVATKDIWDEANGVKYLHAKVGDIGECIHHFDGHYPTIQWPSGVWDTSPDEAKVWAGNRESIRTIQTRLLALEEHAVQPQWAMRRVVEGRMTSTTPNLQQVEKPAQERGTADPAPLCFDGVAPVPPPGHWIPATKHNLTLPGIDIWHPASGRHGGTVLTVGVMSDCHAIRWNDRVNITYPSCMLYVKLPTAETNPHKKSIAFDLDTVEYAEIEKRCFALWDRMVPALTDSERQKLIKENRKLREQREDLLTAVKTLKRQLAEAKRERCFLCNEPATWLATHASGHKHLCEKHRHGDESYSVEGMNVCRLF